MCLSILGIDTIFIGIFYQLSLVEWTVILVLYHNTVVPLGYDPLLERFDLQSRDEAGSRRQGFLRRVV